MQQMQHGRSGFELKSTTSISINQASRMSIADGNGMDEQSDFNRNFIPVSIDVVKWKHLLCGGIQKGG